MGGPTLRRKTANINFGKMNFGLMIGQIYKKFLLHICSSHVALPFRLQFIERPAVSNQNTSRPIPSCQPLWFTTPGTMFQNGTATALTINCHEQARSKPDTLINSKSATISFVSLTFEDFKVVHLHLRHGSKSAIIDYLRLAGYLSSTLIKPLDEVIRLCPCVLSTPSINHAPVSENPPLPIKHEKY